MSKPRYRTFEGLDHVRVWSAGPMPPGAREAAMKVVTLPGVVEAAVLPDVHAAGDACVGVSIAVEDRVYPDAAGRDVGCGMLAVPLDVDAASLEPDDALARMATAVPTMLRDDPADLSALGPLSDPRLQKLADRDGARQFGTLGRGNHFVELQADVETGQAWLLVHSGSRGVGEVLARLHIKSAEQDGPLPWLPDGDPRCDAYLHDAAWLREYARRSRLEMAERAAASIGVRVAGDGFDTCHDSVLREDVGGRSLYVHRKGVQLLSEGEPGVLPGSMGTSTLHVSGRDTTVSLGGVSHGCGRLLSRREVRRRVGVREAARQLRTVAYDRRLLDTLRDEAPAAFRDVREVARAQRDLLRTARTLRPVTCVKGR